MKLDAKMFIANWIDENIRAEGYEAPGDARMARILAVQCREAAKAEGISPHDLDEAARDMIGGGDNLVDLIVNAIESANDEEIRRLAAKDD